MVLLGTTTNASGNDSIFVDNCLFKQSAGTNPGRYFQLIIQQEQVQEQRNSDNFITNCNFTGMLGTSDVVVLVGGTEMVITGLFQIISSIMILVFTMHIHYINR
jgi:hypothetical protein